MREISDYIRAINDRDRILDKASIVIESVLWDIENGHTRGGQDDIKELNELLREINKFLDI
jgi:hypothetical protein